MNIKFFSSDVDGTLIGKPDATLAFKKTWEMLDQDARPLLCYNSGRLLYDILELLGHTDLPKPDYLICGVGTLIYNFNEKRVIKQFSDTLTIGWNILTVEEVMNRHPEIVKQPQRYQNKFKSSWHLIDATPEQLEDLKIELREEGLKVNVEYSSSRDLDILPQYANKGNSLKWLLDYLTISPEETIVAGDTGNDSSMFLIDGTNGIVVENAQPELLHATIERETYVASKPFADGVLEGLQYYGVIEEPVDISSEEIRHGHYDPSIRYVVKTSHFTSLNQAQLNFVDLAYHKAIEALKKNVTPLGFSACSLDDNRFVATDQNYRSVWGRDGAISVIGSLLLDDPEIRTCQRNTFITLLTHVSPDGLVPSNVSIDTETPDYSGTGGICAVDSGLWLIIAFYHYIRKTHDYKFLREWFDTLEKCMRRVSALDSNNDALLEIPEAGDWTDLFGRSYNILYDEVLWYNANLLFGRLSELIGNYQVASEYIRKAQLVKEAILRKFWPSVTEETLNRSFAEQQFSLGETAYLLAEITPFAFDWRCDVYANILAALFNVLDLERARIAFRFMWGVGVNDPYPVVNLYPPVNAGDPNWRPYYTVNLLNLPHHYHNGGIWPFIGAEWVKFVSRLGMKDIAQQELYKLAQLNQTGVSHDWEFNEWVHGTTGRPMGKAFQAWSAAGYIQAYHDLQMESYSL
jgi:sucrose-6F-phosphate phosphohydrolase